MHRYRDFKNGYDYVDQNMLRMSICLWVRELMNFGFFGMGCQTHIMHIARRLVLIKSNVDVDNDRFPMYVV